MNIRQLIYLNFIDLIEKWNKAYNLTAIKTKEEMVKLHLLDSLTVLPYLARQADYRHWHRRGLAGHSLSNLQAGIELYPAR